jgi:hypothetical protein
MTPMPVRSPWSVVRRAALHLLARLTHQRAPHVARSASFGLELNISRCTALATGNRGPRFATLPPLGQHDQLGARNVRVSLVLHLDPIRAAHGPIRPAAALATMPSRPRRQAWANASVPSLSAPGEARAPLLGRAVSLSVLPNIRPTFLRRFWVEQTPKARNVDLGCEFARPLREVELFTRHDRHYLLMLKPP